jgi:hypothetical protein
MLLSTSFFRSISLASRLQRMCIIARNSSVSIKDVIWMTEQVGTRVALVLYEPMLPDMITFVNRMHYRRH